MIISYNSTQELKELLVDFHKLTNMKICIFDSELNEIMFYPKRYCDFCNELRADPSFDKKCKKCDEAAFSVCRQTKKIYIYSCHINLTECIVPILVANSIQGYIVIGQIKENETFPLNSDVFMSFGKEKRERLVALYKNYKAVDKEKILAAAHIIEASTGYTVLKQYLETIDLSLSSRIDKYISLHLTENLGNEILCREFGITKRELYVKMEEYFNCTPAEYIKKSRLNHAVELLKTSNYKVYEVAEMCGICDYNYFSKIFKKQFGLSPKTFLQSKSNAD